jgi:O-antigen ligase
VDKFILILILVGIVSGQLVQLPIAGFSLPLIDAVILLSFLFLLTKTKFNILRSISLKWFLGIVVVFGLSLAVNLSGLELGQALMAGAYLARLVIYGLVGFMLVPHLKSQNMLFYLTTLGIFFLAFIAVSFLQFGLFPSFEIFEYLGWDPHQFRLVGTFFDPNFSAIFLSFGALLSVLVLLRFGLKHWQWLGLTLLSLLGVIVTTSRSGLIAVLSGMAGLIIFMRSKVGWAFLIILMMSVLLLPSFQSRIVSAFTGDSFKFRQESWQEGWQLTKDNPIFGVGYNTLPIIRKETVLNDELLGSHAMSGFDSSLVTISATSGFLGLGIFLVFVYLLFVGAFKKMMRKNNVFSQWFVVGTTALFFSSIFVNAWLYPPLLACWFLMMSLSLSETNR